MRSKTMNIMHLLTSQSINIDRSKKDIFAFVSNMENFYLWFPEVLQIESSNKQAPNEVGKEYLETVLIPLKGTSQITLKVVEYMQDNTYVTEGDFSPLLPQMRIGLTEISPNETELNWQMYSRNRSKPFRILLYPLFQYIITKRAAHGMKNLKSYLENT